MENEATPWVWRYQVPFFYMDVFEQVNFTEEIQYCFSFTAIKKCFSLMCCFSDGFFRLALHQNEAFHQADDMNV